MLAALYECLVIIGRIAKILLARQARKVEAQTARVHFTTRLLEVHLTDLLTIAFDDMCGLSEQAQKA